MSNVLNVVITIWEYIDNEGLTIGLNSFYMFAVDLVSTKILYNMQGYTSGIILDSLRRGFTSSDLYHLPKGTEEGVLFKNEEFLLLWTLQGRL